jgi:hypothetical protein
MGDGAPQPPGRDVLGARKCACAGARRAGVETSVLIETLCWLRDDGLLGLAVAMAAANASIERRKASSARRS